MICLRFVFWNVHVYKIGKEYEPAFTKSTLYFSVFTMMVLSYIFVFVAGHEFFRWTIFIVHAWRKCILVGLYYVPSFMKTELINCYFYGARLQAISNSTFSLLLFYFVFQGPGGGHWWVLWGLLHRGNDWIAGIDTFWQCYHTYSVCLRTFI